MGLPYDIVPNRGQRYEIRELYGNLRVSMFKRLVLGTALVVVLAGLGVLTPTPSPVSAPTLPAAPRFAFHPLHHPKAVIPQPDTCHAILVIQPGRGRVNCLPAPIFKPRPSPPPRRYTVEEILSRYVTRAHDATNIASSMDAPLPFDLGLPASCHWRPHVLAVL